MLKISLCSVRAFYCFQNFPVLARLFPRLSACRAALCAFCRSGGGTIHLVLPLYPAFADSDDFTGYSHEKSEKRIGYIRVFLQMALIFLKNSLYCIKGASTL